MQPSKRFTLAIALLMVIGASFAFGFYVATTGSYATAAPSSLSGTNETVEVEADFGPFWKAWAVLNEKYAGTSTPDQEKIWGAIEGLTASFGDPYTVFMPPEEAKMFEEEISGNFEGVGMEVAIKEGRLTVVAPLKDTPAERAGIRSGDWIVKIGDEFTEGMPVDEAIKLIRGKAGTTVDIVVQRAGPPNPITITLTRAVIDIPTIKTSVTTVDAEGNIVADSGTGLRDDGVFVIELYSFSEKSALYFKNALREFIDSGSDKLIVDLRGNPGGYLQAAVDIASFFLPSDAIVLKEKFGKEEEEHVYRSRGWDIFDDNLKMAILVDGGSASASEILAGALSENGVAEIVGTQTFGKGSVQELVPITNDTNLKVTVAKWFTPSGVSISEEGITPDHEVPVTAEDIEKKRDPQMAKAIEILTE